MRLGFMCFAAVMIATTGTTAHYDWTAQGYGIISSHGGLDEATCVMNEKFRDCTRLFFKTGSRPCIAYFLEKYCIVIK